MELPASRGGDGACSTVRGACLGEAHAERRSCSAATGPINEHLQVQVHAKHPAAPTAAEVLLMLGAPAQHVVVSERTEACTPPRMHPARSMLLAALHSRSEACNR